MKTDTSAFDDLVRQPIRLRRAEICVYQSPAVTLSSGLTSIIRRARGLSRHLKVTKVYLHLFASDGAEGWYGPLDTWSGVTPSTVAKLIHQIGRTTSIAEASQALNPFWPTAPTSCAALDCALWDLVCRSNGCSLWSLLENAKSMVHGSPPFYGSALGLSLQHAHVMHEVLSSSYRIVKWSLNFEISIDEQLLAISRLGVPWTSIALDAHGRLTVEETRKIQDFAPELAWLEDPFPSADDENWNRAVAETSGRIPRLVVGEDVFSVERIEDLAILPVVHAVNLEVERLGITRSIHLFHGLMARSQTCHLHGRALVPSSHLALAFPSIVRWVECHLAFGFERLATIEGAEPSADPRAIVNYCLNQKGIGVKPTARAGFSNEVLDVPL